MNRPSSWPRGRAKKEERITLYSRAREESEPRLVLPSFPSSVPAHSLAARSLPLPFVESWAGRTGTGAGGSGVAPSPSTTNANRLGRRSGRKRLGETGTSNFRGKGSSVKQLRFCLKETIDAPYSWSYSGKDFKRRGFALESSLYGTAEERGKGGKRVLAAVAL